MITLLACFTNNPPFNIQMFNLNNYMGLSARQPESNFSDKLEFNKYSRGMGAIGLPWGSVITVKIRKGGFY